VERASEAMTPTRQDGAKPTVLFIDDDPNVLSALKRGLGSHCMVTIATNAVDAFTLFSNNGPFSVVVSDLRMPDLSGVEVLKAIHCRSPATAGIVLTGSGSSAPPRGTY
jgi:phosphoserine phosphatase RsbU/P